MRILIVGAGTVGQVYGYHLWCGGAEVTYYVRPKYVEQTRKGLTLYALNKRGGDRDPLRMKGFGVISTDAEVLATVWDYVILCTHADALKTPWFDGFAQSVGNATIVNLHPDLDAREAVNRRFETRRRIDGLIALIAFQLPLPGSESPPASDPGVAFWLPPLSKVPFQGPEDLVAPLLAVFRRGKFPCRRESKQGDTATVVAADNFLIIFVLALEAAGWSFETLLLPERLSLLRQATLEAFVVQCHARGLRKPNTWILHCILSPLALRALIRVARCLIPFDLQAYLRVHFTKIREQRRQGFLRTLEIANQASLPVTVLEHLGQKSGLA